MIGASPNFAGVLSMGSGASPEGGCGGGSCSGDGQPTLTDCPCSMCCTYFNTSSCGGIDGPPGSGSPSSQGVIVSINAAPYIRDVDIYCLDTGETKRAICGTVTFYHKDSTIKTYTTDGGFCTLCPPSFGTATANSGRGAGTPPTTVNVQCPA